jgi:A/G-specific adenine glycosylase
VRVNPADAPAVRAALLDWYDAHARRLPWRTPPGAAERPDPYRVWLSEVMLQQTTVPHATGYFLDFTRRWPTVCDLAVEEDGAVMAAWAGLGYYARARNLLACARAVAGKHGGRFPDTEAGLLALPGIGAYTAAAVAAIAFDRPANVVDGNVERVMARLFAVETPVPAAKPELKRLAGGLVTAHRPGDWAQALMDHGATICRPRQPLCDRCPVSAWCAALKTGDPDAYPRKSPKAPKPRRFGHAFVLTDATGRVALVRRPPRGLLGGMLALPTSDWASEPPALDPPVQADWRAVGAIEHVFTHFALTLQVHAADGAGEYVWMEPGEAAQALPTVFRKALLAAISGSSPPARRRRGPSA